MKINIQRGGVVGFEKITINQIRPFVRCIVDVGVLVHTAYVVALEHRIFYLEQGKATFWVGDKRFDLQKNDVFYVSVGTPYKMESETGSWVSVLYFDLTMKNSDFYQRIKPRGIDERLDYLCNYKLTDKGADIDYLYSNNNPTTVKWINRIMQHSVEESTNEYIKNTVSGLVIVLLSTMFQGANAYAKVKSSVSIANEIMEYIHKHYFEKINLDDLATKFNFHKNYLNRCVKNETGMSIYKYLLSYRLERAMNLLMYTNMSVKYVAQKTGFENQKSFSVAFKKMYSISPSKLPGDKYKNMKEVLL